jgi:hypothetical protein
MVARRRSKMRVFLVLALMCAAATLAVPVAAAEASKDSVRDRVDDLQQEVDSLTEDIEDLGEPVEEFELYDQCAYTIGVTEFGTWGGPFGYLFSEGGQQELRPALAFDMRGFGTPQYTFLSFPGEEPPSIECNEDAGEEFIDQ